MSQQKVESPLFQQGLKDGLPICLGYISVAFTFGMMATEGGLAPWSSLLISMTNLTSAGQFAGTALILSGGTLLEIRAMAPLMFGSTALLVVAVPWGPGSSAARPGWTRAAPSWPPAPAACRPWWAWPPTWAPTPLPCWPSIWCACTPSCCWRRSWAGCCTVCCRTADTGHKKTAGEGASPPGPDSHSPAATAGRISSKQRGHIPAAPLPDAIKKSSGAAGAMMPQCVLARIPSGTGMRMPFPKHYSEKRRRGSGPSR